MATPTLDRFMGKVVWNGCADECWIWAGARDPVGYGRFHFKGNGRLAHRVAYELFTGTVPAELVLHHRCVTPACVNPAHLEPMANAENVRCGRSGVLNNWNAKKTHCPRGHPLSGDNLRGGQRGKRSCKTCHREQARERKGR